MDTAYRNAIMAVFDSIQPEASWRLEFFSGKAGPVLVAQSVGEALLAVAQGRMWGSDGSSPVL